MGIRISEMEEATTFGADDYVPIVTNGTNKKALGQKIKDFIAGFFATKTGDNISDKEAFRSAIEISATNTPFDKTGTGMTAENVQAGIAELSSNKANISGDNIANPSAFRSAIEACKLRWQGIDATTSANGYLTIALDNSKPIISVQIFDANGLMYGVPLISSSTAKTQWIVIKDISTNNRVGNTRVTGRAYYLE